MAHQYNLRCRKASTNTNLSPANEPKKRRIRPCPVDSGNEADDEYDPITVEPTVEPTEEPTVEPTEESDEESEYEEITKESGEESEYEEITKESGEESEPEESIQSESDEETEELASEDPETDEEDAGEVVLESDSDEDYSDSAKELFAKLLKGQDKKWNEGLTKEETEELKPKYDQVREMINETPSIGEILKLPLTADEHCDLIRKHTLLSEMDPCSSEFVMMRNSLRHDIEKAQLDLQADAMEVREKINWTPSFKEIMASNLSTDDKVKLMEKVMVLDQEKEYSPGYFAILGEVKKELERAEKLDGTMALEQQALERELEEELLLNQSLKQQILQANRTKQEKTIIYEKFVRMEQSDPGSEERIKLEEWIRQALKLPGQAVENHFPEHTDNATTRDFMQNLREVLDRNMYGLEAPKEEILFTINQMMVNPNGKSKALALLGPPGVGKTCLIRSLGEAFGMPFEQISLGGLKDSEILNGHSYTYTGAQPGLIAKALIKAKCKNCIIFFDEVDKLAETEKGQEVANNLMHLVDPTQNSEYRDNYFAELPLDVSNVWFIYSMNDASIINPTLRDRLPIVELPGYKTKEKIEIVKNFTWPRTLQEYGMDPSEVTMSQTLFEYLVNKDSSKKGGMRDLEKMVRTMCKKISLMKNTLVDDQPIELSFKVKRFSWPLTVTQELIDTLVKTKREEIDPSVAHIYM